MSAGLALRFGPWIALALALAVVWGLWGRLDAATSKLDAANAIIVQKEKDAALSADLVKNQAEALRTLEANVTREVQVVYAQPTTNECARSPAMRAASGSLRQLFGAGGPAP